MENSTSSSKEIVNREFKKSRELERPRTGGLQDKMVLLHLLNLARSLPLCAIKSSIDVIEEFEKEFVDCFVVFLSIFYCISNSEAPPICR